MTPLTPNQINQLQSLGISVTPSTFSTPISNSAKNSLLPLISISGATLILCGGIILLKSQTSATPASTNPSPITHQPQNQAKPTQSATPTIQQLLLTSQQLFSQALQAQNASNQPQLIDLINQAITAATQAIRSYPHDYRGFEQRARIYHSLVNSRPDLIDQTITDYLQAAALNPTSADITRQLASLYAAKGNAAKTIYYLSASINLNPTDAQNFYDLARIQQQAGLIPQAISTYDRLLPLIADPTQQSQVQLEKQSLEQLVAQCPNCQQATAPTPQPSPTTPPLFDDSFPAIQALADSGLIIAAPETGKNLEVDQLTESNALSGSATLPANQKSLEFTNNHLTPQSQVYLTVTKGGKNHTLKVLSRSGQTFTVGFDSPLSQDVEFKWWIIN